MSSKNITVLSLGDESAAVLGNGDAHLKRIEKESSAEILVRGDDVHIKGSQASRNYLERIFVHLRTLAAAGISVDPSTISSPYDCKDIISAVASRIPSLTPVAGEFSYAGLKLWNNGDPSSSLYLLASETCLIYFL